MCSCHDSGICLDSRHASWVVASLILLCFGFFAVGYFMGKRSAIQDLNVVVDQDSLADKIQASLYTMQESKVVVAQQQDHVICDEKDADDAQEVVPHQDSNVSVDAIAAVVENHEDVQVSQQQDATMKKEALHREQVYYAQLVGFGTQQAAERFAQKLKKNNIPVQVKSRQSKTAKGKKITWYQVVTQEFSDKTALEKMVNEVKTKERLKDVRIVTC